MDPSWGTWEAFRGHFGRLGTLFLDGSGTCSGPRARRCGWGIAWLVEERLGEKPKCEGWFFGSLGDEKHTVAKAELEALIKALELIGAYCRQWLQVDHLVG